MQHKQYHLTRQPIPDGFRIYEEGIAIPGIQHYRAAAIEFCKASDPNITIVLEPANPHDKNAIAIIGSWKTWLRTKEKQIGYVPRETAESLATTGLAGVVRPRLYKTYVGFDDFVEIEFQIVGPAEHYRTYRPISEADPFERVKHAKSIGDYDAALDILADLIAATEADSKSGVAPFAYLEAAKIFRKLKLPDEELAILERYEAQPKGPGVKSVELAERLEKLRGKKKQATK